MARESKASERKRFFSEANELFDSDKVWTPNGSESFRQTYLIKAARVREALSESVETLLHLVTMPEHGLNLSGKEILLAIANGGSPEDINNLRKILRSPLGSSFTQDDWRSLFAERVLIARDIAEKNTRTALAEGRHPEKAEADPVCEWIRSARPGGLNLSEVVLSADLPSRPGVLSRFSLVDETSQGEAVLTTLSRFESENLRAASRTPAELSFGTEGDALSALLSEPPNLMDFARSAALLSKQHTTAVELYPPANRAALPAILSAVGSIKDPSVAAKAVAILSENDVRFSPEAWRELYARRLFSNDSALFGPDSLALAIHNMPLREDPLVRNISLEAMASSYSYIESVRGKRFAGAALPSWAAVGVGLSDIARADMASGTPENLRRGFLRARTSLWREILSNPEALTDASVISAVKDFPISAASDARAFANALSSIERTPGREHVRDALALLTDRPPAIDVVTEFKARAENVICGPEKNPVSTIFSFLSNYKGTSSARDALSFAMADYFDLKSSGFSAASLLSTLNALDLSASSGEHDELPNKSRLESRLRSALRVRASSLSFDPLTLQDVEKVSERVLATSASVIASMAESGDLPSIALAAAKKGVYPLLFSVIARAEAENRLSELGDALDSDGRGVLFWTASKMSDEHAERVFSTLFARGSVDPTEVDATGHAHPLSVAAVRGLHGTLRAVENAYAGILDKSVEGVPSVSVVAEAANKPLPWKKKHIERLAFASSENGRKELSDWAVNSGILSNWDGDLHERPADLALSLSSIAEKAGRLYTDSKEDLEMARLALQIGNVQEAFHFVGEIVEKAIDAPKDGVSLSQALSLRRELAGRKVAATSLSEPAVIVAALDKLPEQMTAFNERIIRAVREGDYDAAREAAKKTIALHKAIGFRDLLTSRLGAILNKIVQTDELVLSADASVEVKEDIARAKKILVAELGRDVDELEKSGGGSLGYVSSLRRFAERGLWASLHGAISQVRTTDETSSISLFSEVVKEKAQFLAQRQNARAALGASRMEEIVKSSMELSSRIYNDADSIPDGYQPINPTELGLAGFGVDPTGRKFKFSDGVWKSDVCRATVSSKIVDGQEIVFLAVRGTHWKSNDQDETTNKWQRRFSILKDYAQIWRHADRIDELAKAASKYAHTRGAKFVMTGHSLGGSTVETLADRNPNVDAAFVFASAGTGEYDPETRTHSRTLKSILDGRERNPKVVQFREGTALDPIPFIGRLGGYVSSALGIDTSNSFVPDGETSFTKKALGKFSALARNVASMFSFGVVGNASPDQESPSVFKRIFSGIIGAPFRRHNMDASYIPSIGGFINAESERRDALETIKVASKACGTDAFEESDSLVQNMIGKRNASRVLAQRRAILENKGLHERPETSFAQAPAVT